MPKDEAIKIKIETDDKMKNLIESLER